MRSIASLALLTLAACSTSSSSTKSETETTANFDEMPQPAVQEQHAWLQQLVGEWNVSSDMTMEPGAEPMKMESTESVRSLGGLWIVAEGKADFAGTPFNAILTLGYDPEKKAFVGSWIDTFQTHLWTYTGTLDAAKKVLTLSAEGPAFGDTSKIAQYHDAIEIVSPDHKTMTSSILGEDGQWTTYMRADYTRKK